jgi:hypothetical protein
MPTTDEKGFIHYTQAELNRIPSFEQRDQMGAEPAGTTRGTIGVLGGAALGAGLGSTFGPAGTVAGGIGGAVAGNAAAGAAQEQQSGDGGGTRE